MFKKTIAMNSKGSLMLVIAVLVLACDGQVEKGQKGEIGQPGPPGDVGQRGPPGDNGQDGPWGPKGSQGARGHRGEAGYPGVPGQKGAKGEPALYLQVPQQYGLFGVGPPGAQGPMGPSGPQGQPGHTGDIGEPGSKGEKGQEGRIGRNGPPGEPGESGYPGVPGHPGTAGVIFTHWASADCPTGSTIVYNGSILILEPADNNVQISRSLCLTMDVNNTLDSAIGMRGIATARSNVNCSLCLIPPAQITVFVHYGSSSCPTGWNVVYNGIMAVLNAAASAAAPICASVSGGVSRLQSMESLSFLTDERGNELACSLCSMIQTG